MTEFVVANPAFRERVKADFAAQPATTGMGIALETIDPGHIVLNLPFREELTQQNGFLHAGILSTALDTACGFSAYTLIGAETTVLTIENKLNLLRPAVNGPFRVVGTVVKAGRVVIVSEGTVHDSSEKLIATMTATNMAVER